MKCEILIGNIASFKSTYCKEKAKKGWIIINDDSIVTSIHGGNYNLYDKKNKILYKSIENHILASSFMMKKNVIVDRGLNITISSRKRFIDICTSFEVPVNAIVFKRESVKIHAKRRFNSDNRGHNLSYWKNVAKSMDDRFEMPSVKENWNKIVYF